MTESPPYTSRSGRKVYYCSRTQFRLMNDLPYGQWTCEDGLEVLFNRFYEPIWQRLSASAPALAADPKQQIPWKTERWFYDDRTRHKAAAAKRALKAWGVDPEQRLPDDDGLEINARRTVARSDHNFAPEWEGNTVRWGWTKVLVEPVAREILILPTYVPA